MTESTQATLLRRMTRPQGQGTTGNPLTSSRAVRLALTKAANDTVGLVLTVNSVAEETTGLDDMLGSLAEDLMLVALLREGGLVGLVALDMEMRAAVLEMETMGAVLGQPAEQRVPTRADKMLCDPLLEAFLSAFPAAVLGTPLEGWIDGVTHGERIDSARAAGLLLADCAYRIVRLSVELGGTERQAHVVMTLPLAQDPITPQSKTNETVDWQGPFQDAVADAPASLTALLHRFPVSFATAQALQAGSILPLPGCTVNSVRLLSADGKAVAQAKLGQVGGYRAVRLEAAPLPELLDIGDRPQEGPIPLADPTGVNAADEAPVIAGASIDMQDQQIDTEDSGLAAVAVPEGGGMPFDPDVP